MPDFRPGTPWGDALRALDPIIAAEKERGNHGRLDLGDSRDSRPGYRMHHPLDLNALRAQFVLGEGIVVLESTPVAIQFRGRADVTVFTIGGGDPRGRLEGWRQRRWWKKWTNAPRAKEPFANPFAELNA